MSTPLTPDEIAAKQKVIFPKEVIDAVNELLALNYNGFSATIYQDEIVKLAKAKIALTNTNDEIPFDYRWMNFEEMYRAAGWSVVYDKPGYNEDYRANFTFKKKK